MKKISFLMVVILILTVVFSAEVFATDNEMFEWSDCDIRVGHSIVKLEFPIYMKENRIYVSIRSICDALGIPIEWDGENNEIVIDMYNNNEVSDDKSRISEDGVIPDEQTALMVGKTILEKHTGGSLEYETKDKIYYLTVTFDEQYNGWRVYQSFKFKDDKKGWSAGGGFCVPTVLLSKDTGEVLYINTYSMFSD